MALGGLTVAAGAVLLRLLRARDPRVEVTLLLLFSYAAFQVGSKV